MSFLMETAHFGNGTKKTNYFDKIQSKLLIHVAQWERTLVRDETSERVRECSKRLKVAFHCCVCYDKSDSSHLLLLNKLSKKLGLKTRYYYPVS